RTRNAAVCRPACVRAFLHHQGTGQRHRSRAQCQLRDHPGTRRSNHRRKHSRDWHNVYHSAPALHRDTKVTRILIVDDEETIRLALRKFLRSRGYEVEIAGAGDQALEVLEKESFSLMLCDVRMPGMTGVQVVPRARALDPDLAIIMLTAVNDAATATEVLSSGASDYLMKPVELADLQQAVDRALSKRV